MIVCKTRIYLFSISKINVCGLVGCTCFFFFFLLFWFFHFYSFKATLLHLTVQRAKTRTKQGLQKLHQPWSKPSLNIRLCLVQTVTVLIEPFCPKQLPMNPRLKPKTNEVYLLWLKPGAALSHSNQNLVRPRVFFEASFIGAF